MKKFELLPNIKVYEVDYSFIINNYLDRSLWDKTWTLFQYKHSTVTLCLDSINTKSKIINFEVRLDWSDGEQKDYSYTTIAFQLGEMSVNQLKNIINNCIWSRIIRIEENLIEKSREYQNIRDGWYTEKERLEEIANEFLDSEGVTHKSIREAYVDKFIDDNDTLWDDLQDYKNQMKFKVLTELYLVFAKSIKDEERTKQVANNQITNIQELLDKVADFMVYIETEDYTNEKKELLPAI